MINNPRDIEKIKQELNNITFEQLDKAIEETDEEWKDKQFMSEELKEAQDFFCTRYTFMGDELAKNIDTILKALEEKDKQIEIKNEYMKLICNILYDYDGYYDEKTQWANVKGLVCLIDETLDFLKAAINNDTSKVMYEKGTKGIKLNILMKEIEENKSNE